MCYELLKYRAASTRSAATADGDRKKRPSTPVKSWHGDIFDEAVCHPRSGIRPRRSAVKNPSAMGKVSVRYVAANVQRDSSSITTGWVSCWIVGLR